ncbi:uncharacterized protein METZ01_LOCUS493923, partial [marine metagenome]
ENEQFDQQFLTEFQPDALSRFRIWFRL